MSLQWNASAVYSVHQWFSTRWPQDDFKLFYYIKKNTQQLNMNAKTNKSMIYK